MEKITIDLSLLHGGQAKLSSMNDYCSQVTEEAGSGNEVTLTGAAPVWMYLRIAHTLHGKVNVLKYNSPSTGEITIFNHNPY